MNWVYVSELTTWAFRRIVPILTTVLLICLAIIPVAHPTLSQWMPMLGLAALFYWIVYRPVLLQIGLTFALALFIDLLTGVLLGTTVIASLLMYRYVSENEQFYRFSSDALIWVTFATFAGLAIVLDWTLTAILHWTWVNPVPGFFRWIATVVSYPIVYVVLLPIDRLFLGAPDN